MDVENGHIALYDVWKRDGKGENGEMEGSDKKHIWKKWIMEKMGKCEKMVK